MKKIAHMRKLQICPDFYIFLSTFFFIPRPCFFRFTFFLSLSFWHDKTNVFSFVKYILRFRKLLLAIDTHPYICTYIYMRIYIHTHIFLFIVIRIFDGEIASRFFLRSHGLRYISITCCVFPRHVNLLERWKKMRVIWTSSYLFFRLVITNISDKKSVCRCIIRCNSFFNYLVFNKDCFNCVSNCCIVTMQSRFIIFIYERNKNVDLFVYTWARFNFLSISLFDHRVYLLRRDFWLVIMIIINPLLFCISLSR